eukprot:scaffold4404_cov383-Prasinococcus_capsulatus_cf.AAC.5
MPKSFALNRLFILTFACGMPRAEMSARTSKLLQHRHDAKGQVDAFADPIAHQVEFSVRRDEADCLVRGKLGQVHALVERAVVQVDSAFGAAPSLSTSFIRGAPTQAVHAPTAAVSRRALRVLRRHGEAVVQAQLQLRSPGKLRAEHHLARHLAAQDVALVREEQVDALDHVQEDLVLLVLDPLGTPADSPCHLQGGVGRGRGVCLLVPGAVEGALRALRDVQLEDLRGRHLR